MFKNILVCSDLTPGSAAAIRAALAFDPPQAGGICALHVVPLPAQIRRWAAPVFKDDVKLYFDLLERQVKQAQLELERQVNRLAGGAPPAGLVVRAVSGDPASMIASTADDLHSDLIIVARGRRGILGFIAEQVVRMTGRTVLVVPGKVKAGAKLSLVTPPQRKPLKRVAGARASAKPT